MVAEDDDDDATNPESYSPTAVSAAANISPNAAPSPKSSPSHTSAAAMAGEMDSNGKYRFGPLVWRSSKERKKTNRRDKCNSGDSGIQVEIDDGYGPECIQEILMKNNRAGDKNKAVRRAFSAKVPNMSPTSSLSMKANAIKKDGGQCLEVGQKFHIRSLSQPNGLDRIQRNGYNRPIYAEVLYAFQPVGPQELLLEQGALVEILRKEKNGGPWWYGRIKHDAILEKILEKQEGWFPKDFVRILNPFVMEMENKSETAETSKPPTVPASRPCEIVAKNNENHITTITVEGIPSVDGVELEEEDVADSSYTNHLPNKPHHHQHLVKGIVRTRIHHKSASMAALTALKVLGTVFIPEMRRRIDIFSTESLNLIFSNIECIWRFQQKFLEALKLGIETDRIAKVFLEHQSEFMVYSSYCNSYPRALMELESYSRSKEAKKVLENCRAAENLPELPLSAHLLAPIQRICRYPLQLNELIKHTQETYTNVSSSNHHASPEDFDEIDSTFVDIVDTKESLDMALNAMKKVTETVNEGKRHSEHLARFQSSFESFQGPPLHFHSTRFFMQTDATRVSPNLWNNTFTLFLFDHQLIYCKKDLLKRNHFMYKGRIFLDNCRILNLPDGKIFGATVKNALRIFCESRQKWFDFKFAGGAGNGPGSATDDEDYSLDYSSDCDIYDIHQHSRRMSPAKFQKYNESLPKKPKNFQSPNDYNSSSLSRRRLGNWFRKSKSTNTTPNQSPTHMPHQPSPMTVELQQPQHSEFKVPPQPQHTQQSSMGSTTSSATTATTTSSSTTTS
uniref:DH domain-containing protein n=1 Tax=Megaselia scalaris TaxID=36166 RepID=T1GNJ1_MEGSC